MDLYVRLPNGTYAPYVAPKTLTAPPAAHTTTEPRSSGPAASTSNREYPVLPTPRAATARINRPKIAYDDSEDDEWQTLSSKRQRPSPPSPPLLPTPIPTRNKFAGLPEHTDSAPAPAPNSRDARKTVPRKDRVPPIILKLGNLTHGQLLHHIGKDSGTIKYLRGGKASIAPKNLAAHSEIIEELQHAKQQFHTYTAEAERTKRTVIRGLPKDISPEEVQEDLKEQGFETLKVARMTAPRSEHPPLLATFAQSTDMGKLRTKVLYIARCRVSMAKYRSGHNTHGTQCYRCQEFGHTSRNCHRDPRCVKCLQEHATAECLKQDRTESAACCNCQGDHPANYRNCPRRLEYVARLQQRTPAPLTRAPQRAQAPPPPLPTSGRTWSDVTRSPVTDATSSPPPAPEPASTATTRDTDPDLITIIKLALQVRARISKTASLEEKILAVVELLQTLDG